MKISCIYLKKVAGVTLEDEIKYKMSVVYILLIILFVITFRGIPDLNYKVGTIEFKRKILKPINKQVVDLRMRTFKNLDV